MLGGVQIDPGTQAARRTAAAQRRRRDVDRRRNPGSRRVSRRRTRYQCVRRRLRHRRCGHRRHRRYPRVSEPRRTAGRDRPRIQSRAERRRAAESAADRAAQRHPVSRHRRTSGVARQHEYGQQTESNVAAARRVGRRSARDRLRGHRLRQPDQSRGQPPTGIPRRRGFGAVHAQSARHRQRAEKNRRRAERLDARERSRERDEPHVLRPGRHDSFSVR